ncbi:MAG: hypothetical protein E6J75_02030 [Deltaproteobacteria bacterium]|nr:MAG: hypothetical protein E6J75_02030 [Deltaproteobacteria bacterium]
MDFLVVKTLHLVAVFLWTGMVPIELYAGWRFARARTDDERLGLAVLVNRLRLCQALPYGLLVVATGAWLSGWYGIALLARQPWYVAKLALVGLLVAGETYIAVASRRIEVRCRVGLSARQRVAQIAIMRAPLLVVLVGVPALAIGRRVDVAIPVVVCAGMAMLAGATVSLVRAMTADAEAARKVAP